MAEKSTSSLLDNRNALSSYLDDLLLEATDLPDSEALGQPVEDACSSLILESLSDTVNVPGKNIELAVPVNVPEPIAEPEVLAQDPEHSISFPAQFLMFKVATLKLSVPLIELSSVLEVNSEMTHLPGSGDWIEGVLSHRDQNVKIVDSRKLFKIPDELSNKNQDQRRYLVLAGGEVALSCDSVEAIVTLDTNEIQWRKERQDELFSGAIRESLASVLNTSAIISYLNRLNSGGINLH
jgi:purine-binding chemotaxis protein CheW